MALELAGALTPRAREVGLALVRTGVRGVVLMPDEGASEDVGRPTLRGHAPLHPDVSLLLRPEAFAQAHAEGTSLLVERALALLAPTGAESALELHAGNGTFTFALAARAASVLAVESSSLSVSLAAAASTEARVGNVRFVQGDAERVSRGLVKEGRRFEVLLVDPPRTGAPGIGTLARDLGVRRLLYVACDAGALARDSAGFDRCRVPSHHAPARGHVPGDAPRGDGGCVRAWWLAPNYPGDSGISRGARARTAASTSAHRPATRRRFRSTSTAVSAVESPVWYPGAG